MLRGCRNRTFPRSMTDERRTTDRRRRNRRIKAEPPSPAESRALVPTETAPGEPDSVVEPAADEPRRDGFATYAAQVLGQPGQKRGLRGGPETLDRARTTYLGTEWSGPSDRRPHPGQITKTEI